MGILTNFNEGDVLLLENAHRLVGEFRDFMCSAMQGFRVNFLVDKGPLAKTINVPLKRFICVATSRDERGCPSGLLDLFDLKVRLRPYSHQELNLISERVANYHGLVISPAMQALVTNASDGTPHGVEVLIRRLARLARIAYAGKDGPASESDIALILATLGIQGPRTDGATMDGLDLSKLSGVEFERVVSTVLQQMGFRCEMTKASGDGGIDIIATLDQPLTGGRYLIQCKRFAPDTPVGAPIVREFYGALTADPEALKGILITTSDFTSQAREFASGLRVELIDGGQLKRLMSRPAEKAKLEEEPH